jgi:hypothetical protein
MNERNICIWVPASKHNFVVGKVRLCEKYSTSCVGGDEIAFRVFMADIQKIHQFCLVTLH